MPLWLGPMSDLVVDGGRLSLVAQSTENGKIKCNLEIDYRIIFVNLGAMIPDLEKVVGKLLVLSHL